MYSRRAYTERGGSRHQLWIWNPEDGSIKPLTHSQRNHFDPACERRGVIIFHAGEDPYDQRQMWSFNRTTKVERPAGAQPKPPDGRRVPLVGCESSAWSSDETRGACVVGQNIVFYNASQGAIAARVPFEPRPTPPEVLGWSPDGKWLLVSTMGAKDHRTSDYFLLNTEDHTWVAAGSGNDALWVPGRNEILYSAPRELSGRRLAQLVTFDPSTGKRTQVTRGKTDNIQPTVCVNR
ncbi:MAG TPA: hypothetical protein VG456_14180 [Candidatus Sulfopaludibacter sp.]|nr:hypothetical protein [Candidatus Sulfopaludibacter sp.]